MNPFEMVVLIILIITVVRIFSGRSSFKDNVVANIIEPKADNMHMQDEIRMLKERIAVLERIATDNSSAIALDREIEKLR